MMIEMSDLLTVTDVARLLDVAGDTVRLMERDGRLPAMRTAGGIRIFQRRDVEKVITKRAQAREEAIR